MDEQLLRRLQQSLVKKEQVYRSFKIGLDTLISENDLTIKDIERVLSGVTDPNPDPEPDITFRTFHIMDHHNQPDLSEMGLEPLKIWYEGSMFDVPDDRDDEKRVSTQDINLQRVASNATLAPQLSCVDIERWANKDNWSVPRENVERYIEVCQAYGESLPTSDHKFGLYSIMPVRDYYRSVMLRGQAGYKEWLSRNFEVEPISDHVDFMFPSLSAFSSVFEGNVDRIGLWKNYAIANIEMARVIAPGKPVYPFLWPRYHPSAETTIDRTFWRAMLETCAEYADGFVIWDDLTANRQDFSELDEWWDETVLFMANLERR